MTSGPTDAIYDSFLKTITEAGHPKARAFGAQFSWRHRCF